jgi:CO/xanthine dehydrogenase Mo-binding subunit/aerobic-type carbon monoxide dehydrogenase small subunit (CoxS/CutS family)
VTAWISLTVNGRGVDLEVDPMRRLSDVLRDDLGLTGTKVGCNAGDCGACTVRLDGRQVAACLVPVAQAAGTEIRTVEGLAGGGETPGQFDDLAALQRAFLDAGAAQCGICTPGMLMAAADLLDRSPVPTGAEIHDALGGVLCRCTGYRKIVEAVEVVVAHAASATAGAGAGASPAGPIGAERNPAAGSAVGARLPKVDGIERVTGTAAFGADARPASVLELRAIRSPHARARFTIGDLGPLHARHPGLVRVLTAADIPGQNRYGIYPTGKDQPALAVDEVRHRGEAVCALIAEEAVLAAIDDAEVPIAWEPLPAILDIEAALAADAPRLHVHAVGNVLVSGRVARGDVDAIFAAAAVTAAVEVETTFVEHAYIEPEAGYARRVGDRIEVVVSTQTPYMDRDEVALILGIAPDRVRIVPTACGGGFGGKLDLSVHPLIAVAAWLLDRPVRAVWTRPESMAASPKRHPARIRAAAAADASGRLTAVRFDGDFDTGAYASWGPTVANRVPIHAAGPYAVPNVLATTRAIHTNNPPAGAFRGFGVPQAAIAHEALMDELAAALGMDALEFRHRNALRAGSTTATGHVLRASAGLVACLDALRPHWARLRGEASAWNADAEGRGDPRRRGAGIGAMWYGIGNTSIANPSTIELGIDRSAVVTLYSGAVDIGQGASTVLTQIAADALGVPAGTLRLVTGDTDRTADAGKSSASRQTFVSGNAARLAGEDLRRQLLRLAEAGDDSTFNLASGRITVTEPGGRPVEIDLAELPPLRSAGQSDSPVLLGRGWYDPTTTPLDADGQGDPYETYAFGAQLATVEVDLELGTVRVLRVVAAHDVGRAINPTQVEGQIHGGIAQGLGFALMEAYVPGRTENLHDYLIPTVGDVPEIECILVEDPEPAGPHGAKGVGEPALVPTAPAILGAIRAATGVRITSVPATPDRVRDAIRRASATPIRVPDRPGTGTIGSATDRPRRGSLSVL